MTGSKMTSITAAKLRTAHAKGESATDVTKPRTNAPYVWDGLDEGERPLMAEEMQAGIEEYRKRRGRPAGAQKELTTIRIDRDILAAFRAGGSGWQTRMNAALRDWLKTHSPS